MLNMKNIIILNMKKYLLIFLISLFAFASHGQVTTTKWVKVANATTIFNENLLNGIGIINLDDDKTYLTLKSIPLNKSISTCIIDVDLKELTATAIKAKNGLIIVTGLKDTIKLGGTLTEPTTISQNGRTFKILDAGHGSVFSQTGIAYTKIDTANFVDSTLITKLYAKKYKLKKDSVLPSGYATNYKLSLKKNKNDSIIGSGYFTNYKAKSKADTTWVNNKFVPYSGATKDLDLNTHSILAQGQQLPLSNGGCQISTITDNGNGSVTLGNGDYHISPNVNGKGSTNYTLTGGTFTLTDMANNYIVADYNNGSPYIHVITDVTLINETTIVPIYTVFRNGNFLHTQNWDSLGLALANKVHQSIVKTQRYRRESGLALSQYGTRNLALTAGRIWTGAVPISLDAIATATDNLFFWYHSGGVWTSSLSTQFNNTQYDNGTNLATLTTNRYAVNWIFRGVESQKHLYIIVGTGDYTEAQATAAVLPAIPVAISSHAVLVAKLIVQKSAATALSIQSAFDIQFGLSAIQSHGDLTGRDVLDSHPGGAITNTPYSTISATTTQLAINELTDEKENISNKENTTVDNSATKYPTVNLLKTYADTKDPSSTNELNTSVFFNKTNNKLEITDAGGTKSDTIEVNADLLINGYSGTINVTSNTVTFNWPVTYANTNYYLDVFPYYTETIDGKSVRVRNAVYDFVKTPSGFSMKLDTIAGVVEYRASRTINSETPANVLLQSDLTTVVGNPGLDTKIPTEKAVRTALSGVVVTENDPIYSASSWFSTTNNSTNWNTAYADRLKWDGGSTGLTAATGRTSLGGTTIGQSMFTLTNPSAITFPRFNLDNTVSALSAADFKTAIGAGSGTVTQIVAGTGLSGGTIANSGTIAVNYGTTSITSCVGNDARLSDTRNTTNPLTVKFDSGTTENTDLYTFNGSVAKTVDIKAGTNVTFTKAANSITINASGGSSGGASVLDLVGYQEGSMSANSTNVFASSGLYSSSIYNADGGTIGESTSSGFRSRLNPTGTLNYVVRWYTSSMFRVDSNPLFSFKFSRRGYDSYFFCGLSNVNSGNIGVTSVSVGLRNISSSESNYVFFNSDGTTQQITDTGILASASTEAYIFCCEILTGSIVYKLYDNNYTLLASATHATGIPTFQNLMSVIFSQDRSADAGNWLSVFSSKIIIKK